MLITLRQYYKGGRYDFLLNSRANIDLLSKRFVVFEAVSYTHLDVYKRQVFVFI